MESSKVRVTIWNDMIRGPAHTEVFIWRITQTGGPEDVYGPIDIGAGPIIYFDEREEAEEYARRKGWVIED